jgi:serine/threonine protein kinase
MSQLVKRRKRLTEFEARFYMVQILEGVSHLHKQQIIHRDLNLGNIFLDANMDIKLGDFGLAAKLDFPGDRKTTICGTPNYIAPEILERKHGHGPPVDIWSIGVILYTFIIGRPPYETQPEVVARRGRVPEHLVSEYVALDVKETYRRIRKNQYSFPPDVEISLQARTMIGRILQLLPESRPSLEEMRADAYLTQNPIPRAIPQMAVSKCPTFAAADLCAPEALPARRPLEPRQTNTQPYASDRPSCRELCTRPRYPQAVNMDEQQRNVDHYLQWWTSRTSAPVHEE